MTAVVERLNAVLDGRYRIQRELGRGGMATVYLADDQRHERKVALKVLKPELAAVVGAERFLAEIKTTANLQHPHILPLFDSGEADGFLYYVMPYVEGESLRQRLDREHQLPVEQAVQIATNLAEALEYAHRRGVIHRDIKPANVLLQAGKPVLSDFGIALAVGVAGGGRLTETGLSLGTPHYMSPEQATGDASVAAASDIYALGCVLHEMLVGEPPYTGNTAQAVLGRIIAGKLTSAREQRPAVPAHVDAVIRKALERLPADRFTDATAFCTALADESFRHGDGAAAAPPEASRSRWRTAAFAATGLAFVLALALAWSQIASTATPVVSAWDVALPDGLALYSGSGVNLDVSADGSAIAFVGISTDRQIQLWLRPLSGLEREPVPIPGTENAQNPRFSPDGESIAYIAGDALMVGPIRGGPPRTIVSDSAMTIGGLAWGDDGMVYYRKLGLGIWRVPAAGGSEEEVTSLSGAGAHQWVDVLPGATGILYTLDLGGPGGDSIVAVSLGSGERRALAQGAMARYAQSGHILYTSAEGTLVAAPFDAGRLAVTGPARPMLERIGVSDSSASTFAVSATGTLAYRAGTGVVLGSVGGGGIPVWVERDGVVTPLDPTIGGLSQAPDVSPDGRKVALEYRPEGGGGPDIRIFDLDQRTLSRMTFDGTSRRPYWRPDGQEIGFRSYLDGDLSQFAVAADGSETTPRLLRRGPGLQEAIWAPPDGRWIVYRQGALSVTEGLFVGDANLYYAAPYPDSGASVIRDSRFQWYAPDMSPDGRWLAYTSHESGRPEVYVRSFPAGGSRQVSVDGGRFPVWTPDGTEIIYQALDGPLVVARVRSEPDFTVLSRVPHPEWPQPFAGNPTQHFDASPDGRILVIDASGIGTRVRDVVVLNFFEELKRRFRD